MTDKIPMKRLGRTTLLILFLKLTMPAAHAAGLESCGVYQIEGYVRSDETAIYLVLNEHTQSQMKIDLPIHSQGQVAGYIDLPISVGIRITQKFDGTRGRADALTEPARLRIPTPVQPLDARSHNLVKSEKCSAQSRSAS